MENIYYNGWITDSGLIISVDTSKPLDSEGKPLVSGKIAVQTSAKQDQLEKQGCEFSGQEALDNHELDMDKPCYCKRPNPNPEIVDGIAQREVNKAKGV